MIPVAGPSVFFLIIVFLLPAIGLLLSAGLIIRVAYDLCFFKKIRIKKSKKFLTFIVITLLLDSWTALVIYQDYAIKKDVEHKLSLIKSRQSIQLKQPMQYDEILLPAGTKIKRYDASDNGEEYLPLKLTGLKNVIFPAPVKIKGMWVSDMDPYGRLRLAENQIISGKQCSKGSVAIFDVPIIDTNEGKTEAEILEDWLKEKPDSFKPSTWTFVDCNVNYHY